jgi:hypothetical protein
VEAFVYLVGLTLFTIFVGIYFGGRKTLRDMGHDCPKLWTRERIGQSRQKADLRS